MYNDYYYSTTDLVENSDNLKTIYAKRIHRTDLPVTFPCFAKGLTLNPARPKWIHQEFTSPVSWVICPVKNNYHSLLAIEKTTFSKCAKFTTERWTQKDVTLRPLSLSKMNKWTYYANDKGELTIFNVDTNSTSPNLSYSLMCYRKRRNSAIPINTYVSNFIEDNIVNGVTFNSARVSGHTPLVPISPPIQNVSIYARKVTLKSIR